MIAMSAHSKKENVYPQNSAHFWQKYAQISFPPNYFHKEFCVLITIEWMPL